MTSEVAEDVVAQPQAVDLGPAVPEGPLPVAEATAAPAPRNQQRGRGPRRPPRFRQAAAAGSGNRAPAATKNVETARCPTTHSRIQAVRQPRQA